MGVDTGHKHRYPIAAAKFYFSPEGGLLRDKLEHKHNSKHDDNKHRYSKNHSFADKSVRLHAVVTVDIETTTVCIRTTLGQKHGAQGCQKGITAVSFDNLDQYAVEHPKEQSDGQRCRNSQECILCGI